jgi:uncharacterized protein YndB with AHSA1/START domain
MATNDIHIAATRDEVFAVLSDGWTYSNWVVGTSHMRAVEAEWPAVGSHLFHASGAWPAAIRDKSTVDAVDPGRRLELTALGRPFGAAKIVLELEDAPGGCHVTMHETPSAGPGKWLHNPASEALLHRRNTEALNRLAAIVERRTEPVEATREATS